MDCSDRLGWKKLGELDIAVSKAKIRNVCGRVAWNSVTGKGTPVDIEQLELKIYRPPFGVSWRSPRKRDHDCNGVDVLVADADSVLNEAESITGAAQFKIGDPDSALERMNGVFQKRCGKAIPMLIFWYVRIK